MRFLERKKHSHNFRDISMRYGGTAGRFFLGIIVFSGFFIPRTIDLSANSPVHSLHHALISFIDGRAEAASPSPSDNEGRHAAPTLAPGMLEASSVLSIPDDLLEEIECLALNIYWEAKSEPLLGQIAVAAVTLNRVMHPNFPKTICAVVQQGYQRRLHQCHFSWWCDGRDDTPRERDAWRHALALAAAAVFTGVPDPTRGALWYHANYVRPYWAEEKHEVARIGAHIFYSLPPRKRRSVTSPL